MLSGFITHYSYKKRLLEGTKRAFYIRRFVPIIPVYCGALFAGWLFSQDDVGPALYKIGYWTSFGVWFPLITGDLASAWGDKPIGYNMVHLDCGDAHLALAGIPVLRRRDEPLPQVHRSPEERLGSVHRGCRRAVGPHCLGVHEDVAGRQCHPHHARQPGRQRLPVLPGCDRRRDRHGSQSTEALGLGSGARLQHSPCSLALTLHPGRQP